MYVSECFWPKDLLFDRSRQKSQIVKSALRCFPIVLRLGTTPTTGAADNPLNIYPDISSAVAAAHLSNLSIINIIIIIIIVVNIILIETRNICIVGTEVHPPSTPITTHKAITPYYVYGHTSLFAPKLVGCPTRLSFSWWLLTSYTAGMIASVIAAARFNVFPIFCGMYLSHMCPGHRKKFWLEILCLSFKKELSSRARSFIKNIL